MKKSNEKPKDLSKIMNIYKIPKGETPKKISNTRIGSKDMNIWGGKYDIPDEKYAEFLDAYYRDVFVKGNPEYLTEVQLEKGALLIDVDLRHAYEITTRQFTSDHTTDLVSLYLDIISKCFQLDDEAVIPAYIFQKPAVNRVAENKITKDGLHIIFGISCTHPAQQAIRKRVLEQIGDIWGTELNITNTWDKVFDEGISQGGTNWQLVGSRKPGNDVYRLTGIYTATFDSSDQEFSVVYQDASTFDMEKDIYKLSARYPDHYEPFMTSAFISECATSSSSDKSGAGRRSTTTAVSNSFMQEEFNPLSLKTKDQLDECIKQYIAGISSDNYEQYEAYAYTMTLPVEYFGPGSYSKWFQVGCALRNIANSLFIVWVAFSAKSVDFNFGKLPDLWDQWQKFECKSKTGLTLRSIMYWSRKDAPEKFKEVRENSIDYYIELSLDSGLADFAVSNKSKGSTDYDIAVVLYHLKKDQYMCTSVEANSWFQYMKHRWVKIDSGTSLRISISTELRHLYYKKAEKILEQMATFEDTEDPKYKFLQARNEKVMEIYVKLGRTSDKQNIMREARDLFHDDKFMNLVDTNPYLLCCGNGVWDFKHKIFRDGKPEDYISMSTNLDYQPITEKHEEIRNEIEDFLHKLFPERELYEYMMDHLSSTLVGTALNQTFNNYIGGGRNGKSVLVSLMTKVLGEYKGELPLTAVVTQKRTNVGGVAPEILGLKGKRYAVMQEPRQGDILNEGILKELTSGHDAIQARGLYSSPITFIPQFKLAVCANVLPEIKAQDHGTWRRIRVIPFKSLFTENPVKDDPNKPYQFLLDPTIDEKFDVWKTVFLAMLVDRVLQTGGLVRDCDIVLKASNDYKHKQDIVSQFIDEKICVAEGKYIKKTTLNHEFSNWHNSNFGAKAPQTASLHTEMERRFGLYDKAKGWRGIDIVRETMNSDEDQNVDASEIPDVF